MTRSISPRIAIVLVISVLVLAQSRQFSPPQHVYASTCRLRQVTEQEYRFGGPTAPSVSADGGLIAFSSNADPLGGPTAPGNWEIYLYDSATDAIEQITRDLTPFGSLGPFIHPTGDSILFRSEAALGDTSKRGRMRLVHFDRASREFTDIGHGATDQAAIAMVADDVTRVAFISNSDLAPGLPGNADGNAELFVMHVGREGQRIVQVTDTRRDGESGLIGYPAISLNGQRIAFLSSADLRPGEPGNPDRIAQLYLYDFESGVLQQLTSQGVGFVFPALDGGGDQVAFVTDAVYPGVAPGNPDGSEEIYVMTTDTSEIRQITNSHTSSIQGIALSGDGRRLAFLAAGRILGDEPERGGTQALYVAETATRAIQRTTTAFGSIDRGLSSRPNVTLSGDAERIVFAYGGDPFGRNVDGNEEIFIADCPRLEAARLYLPNLGPAQTR